MAIRFTDVGALRGNLGSQLQGISGNLLGSHVPPPGRTAVLTAPLGGVVATMTGLFTPSPTRTGTLGSTLDGMSCVISATFTPAQTGITPPAYTPNYPTAGFIGIAGVRTFTDPAQLAAIGFYDLFVTNIWDGWANGGRNFETTVHTVKASSTAPTPTLFFAYQNLNAVDTTVNDPYPTYSAEITARNWFLFSIGAAAPFAPANSAPSTTHLVNYTTFAGTNPSGEYPYEFGAKYSYYKFLTTTKSDSRFSGLNAGLAAPSMDGVFQDNFLNNPQTTGDWNRDGTADTPGFPTCAATPWLQAGQLKYANAMRALAPAKYLFANAGDYGVADAGVMKGVLDGLLCESYIGKYWSWETQLDFPTVLSYYYRALSTAKNPALVMFGGSIPDTNTDGTALVRLPTPNGFPPANTQQQWARYIHGVARLGEGMPAINRYSQAYSSDLAALDKYDEFGGIAGLPRGWLGKAIVGTYRPTTPRIAKGAVGLYLVEYDNGIIVVNPKGNGTQTIVPTDIPGNWKFLPGTQDPVRNSGADFAAISIPERDALFLIRKVTGQLQAGHFVSAANIMPLTAARIAHPRPNAETGALAFHRNAHPNVPYQCPIFIQGGAYPHWFEVITAPVGATVGQFYGTTDYAVVNWPTPTSGTQTFTIRVHDQDGTTVDVTWTVTVGTTWVNFVDAVNGNDSTGTGTFAAPWKTYAKAVASTSGGKAVCFRNGTYQAPSAVVSLSSTTHNTMFEFPGESVTMDCSTSTANGGCWGENSPDCFIAGIAFSGGPAGQQNPRCFANGVPANRMYKWRCSSDSPPVGTAGAGLWDNQAFWFLADGGARRSYIAMVECAFSRLPPGGNGYMVLDVYNTQYLVVDRNTFGAPGTTGQQYCIFVKGGGNLDISCSANYWQQAWTPANANMAMYFGSDGSGGQSTRQEFRFNTVVNTNTAATWNSFAMMINNGQNNSFTHQGWSYRNTIVGIPAIAYGTANALTFSSINDVIVHNATATGVVGKWMCVNAADAANAFRNPATIPSITYSITGTECQGSTSAGILDVNNRLAGTLRSSFLYQRGAEIG